MFTNMDILYRYVIPVLGIVIAFTEGFCMGKDGYSSLLPRFSLSILGGCFVGEILSRTPRLFSFPKMMISKRFKVIGSSGRGISPSSRSPSDVVWDQVDRVLWGSDLSLEVVSCGVFRRIRHCRFVSAEVVSCAVLRRIRHCRFLSAEVVSCVVLRRISSLSFRLLDKVYFKNKITRLSLYPGPRMCSLY